MAWHKATTVDKLDDDEVVGGFASSKKKIKKKKLLARGIWQPQLVSMDGRALPPLVDRVKAQRADAEFDLFTMDDSRYL